MVFVIFCHGVVCCPIINIIVYISGCILLVKISSYMHRQEIVKNHECEYNRRIIGRMKGGKLWHLLLQVYAFIRSLISYSPYEKEE